MSGQTTRGGARKGAGRKTTGDVRRGITITYEADAYLRMLDPQGKQDLARGIIEAARLLMQRR